MRAGHARHAGHLSSLGGPVSPSRSALRPLGPDEIRITGGFWGERQELNASTILGHCESWMERIGWIANFDHAADGSIVGRHAGIEFVDSEIYKLLEAMAWELGRRSDAALERRYQALVARVAAAQEDDGYLHTSFGRHGQPARYTNLEWGHELYCFGHLIQAAVARLRTGHDDRLVGVARRLADHVYREFGPHGRDAVCGHPEIEPALAEFARATGEPRYLELARLFVERRGRGMLRTTIQHGHEYFLDDMPVREASVLRGHAVRALYLASGALDVAVETGDAQLASAVRRQWANTVHRRTYITGGMGSHHQDEAFGDDYELPPDRAYSETCAGIGSVMLSWRLLLETGESRYADLIERTLLNNVLASPREDGRAFYYANTLHQRTAGTAPDDDALSQRAESSMRAPWFEVSCCPTNVARTLASVGLYFATATADAVQLHQYGDYEVRTELEAGTLGVRVASGYPFEGRVAVTVDEAPDAEVGLALRVPGWAAGAASVRVNDEAPLPVPGSLPASGRASTALVRRRFAAGDRITLELPMAARITTPDPRVDAVRGTVAIERGPLVLAMESTDLPGGRSVNGLSVDIAAGIETTPSGARVRLGRGLPPVGEEWPYGAPASATAGRAGTRAQVDEVDLIPYFHWANRGPSTMRVWLPVDAR
ncbi:glycoside hydrolase family 127 protein [Microbacterium sp. STN6]|nr:glycoside hydrolase family 127 protein [Microbacterium sp. STN6]